MFNNTRIPIKGNFIIVLSIHILLLVFCNSLYMQCSLSSNINLSTIDTSSIPNRFLVLNCERNKAWEPITFDKMFQNSFGMKNDIWDTCNLAVGEQLPFDKIFNLRFYQAVLISGSHLNCRNSYGLPWFEELIDFIKLSSIRGYPQIYGSCFGAQIIAVSLGGDIDYCKEFILKAEYIHKTLIFSDYLHSPHDNSNKFYILKSHGDEIVKLPENSKVLASSSSCVNDIFICGQYNNILCCQSHPEFDLQYAILDRVWPRIVNNKKLLNEEQKLLSMKTFEVYNTKDSNNLNFIISNFLRYKHLNRLEI